MPSAAEKIGVDDLIGVVIPGAVSALHSTAALADLSCIESPCVRIFSQDPSGQCKECKEWAFRDTDGAAEHQANKATVMHERQIIPFCPPFSFTGSGPF